MTTDEFVTVRVEPERDRYGRYLIHPAAGGKPKAYTRATTIAETLDDRYNLEAWKQRMVALGLVQRPDLYASAASLQADEKSALNRLCDQAREAAAGSAGANLGTALHRFTERINRGEDVKVPAPWDADIAAYKAALHRTWYIESDYIERIVVLEQLGIAGMFDMLLANYPTTSSTEVTTYVADLKTGATLDFSWCAIAVQLAIYAHADTIYDPATKTHEAMPPVDQDKALVIHLPAGKATCTLYEVDIAAGWEAAQHALWTREWRKRKNLAEPVTTVLSPTDPRAVVGAMDDTMIIYPQVVEVVPEPTARESTSTPTQVGGGESAPAPTVEQAPPAVDVGGGESVRPEVAESTPADARQAWDEHLETCDQCNYGKDCIMCEGGYPDAPDKPEMHACNCRHGRADNGWHLARKLQAQPWRREELRQRIIALPDVEREELAHRWPVGVPTFKQSDAHTDEQLDAIAAMIDNVDWSPRKPDDPEPEPEPDLPPAAQWVEPDEGASLDDETVEAIKATITTLDKVTLSQVNDWAAEAHAAHRPFSLSREDARTQRRFEIMRAAIALSPYEPDVQRAALGFVMGEEVQTSVTIGAALGSLTIGEASRLALLAESLGSTVSVVYASGVPTFDGPGLVAVA